MSDEKFTESYRMLIDFIDPDRVRAERAFREILRLLPDRERTREEPE